MVMRAIINLLRRHLLFSIPVVDLVFSILLNIAINLHLKVEKLHLEVIIRNDTMIKYAFKTEFFYTTSLMLCYLAFSIGDNTN